MAHGYWIKVTAYDRDDNDCGAGKIFLFSNGRSKEKFIAQEIENRNDYDVDWDGMKANGLVTEYPSSCRDGLCEVCLESKSDEELEGLLDDEGDLIPYRHRQMDGLCWSGGMSWSHDIEEGENPVEIGSISRQQLRKKMARIQPIVDEAMANNSFSKDTIGIIRQLIEEQDREDA